MCGREQQVSGTPWTSLRKVVGDVLPDLSQVWVCSKCVTCSSSAMAFEPTRYCPCALLLWSHKGSLILAGRSGFLHDANSAVLLWSVSLTPAVAVFCSHSNDSIQVSDIWSVAAMIDCHTHSKICLSWSASTKSHSAVSFFAISNTHTCSRTHAHLQIKFNK